MRKFRIPYIPYRSLLLSTTVLNDIDHVRPKAQSYSLLTCDTKLPFFEDNKKHAYVYTGNESIFVYGKYTTYLYNRMLIFSLTQETKTKKPFKLCDARSLVHTYIHTCIHTYIHLLACAYVHSSIRCMYVCVWMNVPNLLILRLDVHH